MKPKYHWLVGLALLVCGCGDDAPDVGGTWCGRAVATAAECVGGDEVEYLVLAQSGDRVSGRICEQYEKDCNDLQGGRLAESQLTFFYEFSDYRVDGAFKAHGSNTLVGNLHSTKCGCDTPKTLSRVP
jgi:hypothetical protein